MCSNVTDTTPCCNHEPIAVHIYGVYEIAGKPRDFPMYRAALCGLCGAELWARIRDSVVAQYMYYKIMPMPKKQIELNLMEEL